MDAFLSFTIMGITNSIKINSYPGFKIENIYIERDPIKTRGIHWLPRKYHKIRKKPKISFTIGGSHPF